MNPFLQTPTKKMPFAATGLGVAVNTVLGLPQAALGVAKDIGQSIARSAGSAGLTLAKPVGGVEQLQPSDIKSPYGQELYKSFFGTEPLTPIEDNIAQAEIAIKNNPFAQKLGLDKIALPLAFGGVYGGDLLNLVPLGGLEKNAVKALVKETTTEGAIKILQVMKVPEEIAVKFAPHFAEATTPVEVQSVLDTMKGVLGVHGVDAVNASKGVVPGDAKATLANIQDKLGVKPLEAPISPESARTAPITPQTLYHGGAPITEVNLNKTNFSKTFYMSDNATYAKSFGGKNSSITKMTLDPKVNLIDLRKPTPAQIQEITQAIQKEVAKPAKYGESFSFHPYSTKAVIQGIADGKAHFAELPQIKQILKKLGYDGQITSEVPYAKNIGVWNKDMVKVAPDLSPLAQEAQKYSSAEEFVRAQTEGFLYHGTDKATADAIRKAGGFTEDTARIAKDLVNGKVDSNAPVSLTLDKATGELYSGTRPSGEQGSLLVFDAKGLKIATEAQAKGQSIDALKAKGYDGFNRSSPHDEMVETIVFNKSKLKLAEPTVNISISDLRTLQGNKIDLTKSKSIKEPSLTPGSPVKITIDENGTINLHDGAHRIAEALRKGETTVRAQIIGDTKSQLIDFYNKVKPAEVIKPTTRSASEIQQQLADAKLNLSFLEDAMSGHPGQGVGKYVNNFSGGVYGGEFKKGGDVAYQNAVGQDITNGGDINTLQEHYASYQKLKAESQSLKKEIKTLTSEAKSIPSTVLSKAEAKSLQALADQQQSGLDYSLHEGVPSLTDIVSHTATDVKAKVNIIDYLRTPDRVLEKIGFGAESKQLRAGYEAYIKELPKNIDKVTAWSKEVPTEASKTIFQYLDGENVALTDTERKVAGEIKVWLADWAKRLNLPEDHTITNYITHIFDKELVAKEFDEDLAKIITDKIPGSVYDPFLQQRLGAKGFKQNVWEALDAYVKRATRKVNMDEALSAIQAKAGSSLERAKIEASQFKFLQRYVSHINLRPTELDNTLDNTIKSLVGYKYGQRPITYLTRLLRQMTYRGMLGLNPGSALRNISQGINTYAVLGEKYTAIGYTKLFSKGAMQELADEGIMSPGFIQDRLLSSTKKTMEKIDKGLFAFFDGAEKVNRGSAYFGAKSKALGEGKSLPEAIDYAKSIVRKTQFSFGSIDTPVGLQSDIIKTLFQFQNYTLKQTEFLAEMTRDKNFVGLLRYGVAGIVFVATVGKAFGMDISNLIPSFRFGTPPSLKLPLEVGKSVLNVPDKYGQPVDLKQKISNVADSAVGLIPAGTQLKKSIQGIQAYNKGKDTTATGKTRFTIPQTPSNLIRSTLFGKSSLPQAKEYYNSFGKKKSTTNPFLK